MEKAKTVRTTGTTAFGQALHSYVIACQHLSHRPIELLAPANLLESPEKILGPDPRPLAAIQVVDNPALVHHHDAVAQIHRLLHGVRDHQRRQLIALNDLVREAD